MNIAILGAGSIGCYLGGCLAAHGSRVLLIGRSRIGQAIATHGLRLTDWQGRDEIVAEKNLHFVTDASALENADIVLVCVKGAATSSAAQELQTFLPAGKLVVSFQNGIQNARTLKNLLPSHTVIAGMVPFNVINHGNAHFHCGTEGQLAVETAPGELLESLTDALALAQLPLKIYPDLLEIQWGKLLLNLNNSVNALAGIPLLEELHNRDFRWVLAMCIKEALLALKQAGIKPARLGKVLPQCIPAILRLPTWLFTRIASAMLTIDPSARSSMQDDLLAGRLTEIDFINGEVVKLAMTQGTPSSVNQKIISLVKAAEASGSGSPCLDGVTLRQLITE
ncbi:MAG: 2-dehydropantoate 2-reductase [Hahellaceae bacterium]|nr:2-dehydropantoate 2-reductase [Hahellaceae bacterium]MCP5168137.1 2-dehydropantoate 2-reductase [Hahellaceae bacterium]